MLAKVASVSMTTHLADLSPTGIRVLEIQDEFSPQLTPTWSPHYTGTTEWKNLKIIITSLHRQNRRQDYEIMKNYYLNLLEDRCNRDPKMASMMAHMGLYPVNRDGFPSFPPC